MGALFAAPQPPPTRTLPSSNRLCSLSAASRQAVARHVTPCSAWGCLRPCGQGWRETQTREGRAGAVTPSKAATTNRPVGCLNTTRAAASGPPPSSRGPARRPEECGSTHLLVCEVHTEHLGVPTLRLDAPHGLLRRSAHTDRPATGVRVQRLQRLHPFGFSAGTARRRRGANIPVQKSRERREGHGQTESSCSDLRTCYPSASLRALGEALLELLSMPRHLAICERRIAGAMPSQTSVVILGGGIGRRFGCLTSREAPKALLPLANAPLISYPVEWVCAAGLREATVVVGAHGFPAACGGVTRSP